MTKTNNINRKSAGGSTGARVRQYNKSEVPRLKWTPDLHQHFVQAVDRLGGKFKATPKRILQMMSVKGLNISHIKSHLQMYRSWNYSNETEMFVAARHWRLRKRACLPNNFSNRSLSKRVVGNGQKEWECELGNFKQQKYNSKEITINNDIKLQPMEEAAAANYDRFRYLVGEKLKDADVEEKLREVCELSLSFAPSSPTIPKSEKKGYFCPRFDDLSHQTFIRTSKISKTNSTNNNNNHINLDLTISTS